MILLCILVSEPVGVGRNRRLSDPPLFLSQKLTELELFCLFRPPFQLASEVKTVLMTDTDADNDIGNYSDSHQFPVPLLEGF